MLASLAGSVGVSESSSVFCSDASDAKPTPSDGNRASDENSPVTSVPLLQYVVIDAALFSWKVTGAHYNTIST